MLRRLVLSLLLVALAPPLSAQRLERVAAHRMDTAPFHDRVVLVQEPEDARPSNGALMALSGIALGTVGALAGGALGYSVETAGGCSDDWFCGLGGMLLGGFIGEAVGLPLGVHLASRKRSPLSGKIGRSLGAAALGLVAGMATQGFGLLFVPPLQLALTMSPELRSGRPVSR